MDAIHEQIDHIRQLLKDYKEQCKDITGTIADICLNTKVYQIKEKITNITNHAESQLLGRLEIPVGYFKRCSSRLQNDNYDFWQNRHSNKELLIRYAPNEIVRAIFSNKYNTDLDDQAVIPPLLDILVDNYTDLSISRFRKQEDFTILDIIFSNLKVPGRVETEEYTAEEYTAGVSITNSEVGKSSLRIQPMIYIKGNNDYSLVDSSTEGKISMRHIGNRDKNTDKIKEIVEKAQEVAQVGIARIFQLTEETIDAKIELEYLKKTSVNFTNRVCDIVNDLYKSNNYISKFDFCTSILDSIKQLPIFQQYQITQDIGRYMNLFSQTKERLDDILDGLSQQVAHELV